MEKINKIFERYITYILLTVAMLSVVILTLELIWEAYENINGRLAIHGLNYVQYYSKNIGVLFFNVILMLEIISTIKVHDKEPVAKIKIILLVCLVAVSRKVMMLDLHPAEPLSELSLGVLIVSVAAGYYLISKCS
jgi:uncharacterized membrane protein (DUF373 family)